MTNFLVGQNLVDPKWKNHGTGGGTSYTLDYNGTTGSTLLFIASNCAAVPLARRTQAVPL